jgi:hypothetical protein
MQLASSRESRACSHFPRDLKMLIQRGGLWTFVNLVSFFFFFKIETIEELLL